MQVDSFLLEGILIPSPSRVDGIGKNVDQASRLWNRTESNLRNDRANESIESVEFESTPVLPHGNFRSRSEVGGIAVAAGRGRFFR
jgi:hypothetical protein